MAILQLNRVNESVVLFLTINLWKRNITNNAKESGGIIRFTRKKEVVAKLNIYEGAKNAVFRIP